MILDKNRGPQIMGVVNVTPDSFSDGGNLMRESRINIDSVLRLVSQMIEDGADIVDIGGESTKPGAKTISEQEELERVLPTIEVISKEFGIPISVDTSSPSVITEAAKYSVDLINDVSGLSYDKETINFLKKTKLPFVLHHMKGNTETMQKNPKYNNILLDIYDYFENKLRLIRKNGIKHNHIILDPGVGFGKNMKHNITLINNVSIFHSFGLPVMLGISRKRFIKDISGNNDSKDRIGGTVSSCIFSMLQGVQILRVHDVNEVNQGIKVFKKLNFNK